MAPTIAQVLCSTSHSIKLLALVLTAEQITWPHTIKQHLVFERLLSLDLLFLESGPSRCTIILRVKY